jgi:hypothetical protein
MFLYNHTISIHSPTAQSAEELAAISKKNKDDAHKLQKRLSELDNPGGVTNYVTFQQSIIIEETWKQVHKERKQAGIGAQVPSAISKDTEDFFDSYDMVSRRTCVYLYIQCVPLSICVCTCVYLYCIFCAVAPLHTGPQGI